MRHLTTSIIALLVSAAPAHALTIQAPQNYTTQTTLQTWTDTAAAQVPTPNRSIRVRLQPCSKPESAGAACVHSGRWGQIIDFPTEFVNLLGADDVLPGISFNVELTFIHELGHVADAQPGPRPWRTAFRGVFGLRAALPAEPALHFRGIDPWLLAYTPDNQVVRPMEWFADAYSFCAVWPHEPPPPDQPSMYDYRPTPAQHDRACRVIRARRL